MEKQQAINILEDIQRSLNNNDMERAKKDIAIYQRNIEISMNPKIKNLMALFIKYRELYGENGRKTINLAKKIDKEIHKINNKY